MYNNTNTNTLQMETTKVVQELCNRHFHRELFSGAATQLFLNTEAIVVSRSSPHENQVFLVRIAGPDFEVLHRR